jgi:hypothetical protein
LALLEAGLRSRQLSLSLSEVELCRLLDLSELDLLRRFLRLVWRRRRGRSLLLELSSLLYDGDRRRLRRRLSSPPPCGRRSAPCLPRRSLCKKFFLGCYPVFLNVFGRRICLREQSVFIFC